MDTMSPLRHPAGICVTPLMRCLDPGPWELYPPSISYKSWDTALSWGKNCNWCPLCFWKTVQWCGQVSLCSGVWESGFSLSPAIHQHEWAGWFVSALQGPPVPNRESSITTQEVVMWIKGINTCEMLKALHDEHCYFNTKNRSLQKEVASMCDWLRRLVISAGKGEKEENEKQWERQTSKIESTRNTHEWHGCGKRHMTSCAWNGTICA